jgi:ABC-type sugar transport system ATPase subunit
MEHPLGSYPVAIQQLIVSARALEQDTRVLVLDEPTVSLDASEARLLFRHTTHHREGSSWSRSVGMHAQLILAGSMPG